MQLTRRQALAIVMTIPGVIPGVIHGAIPGVIIGAMAQVGPALAEGKVTEANMTQRDYARITRTDNSVEGNPATDPKVEVTPVHGLGPSDEKDLKEMGHGVRVIKGKEWERESPEERDAHLRRIRETAPAGSRFLIEVPEGNVWLLPPLDEETAEYLKRHVYRLWVPQHILVLPVAVSPEPQVAHSDRSGTQTIRVTIRQEF